MLSVYGPRGVCEGHSTPFAAQPKKHPEVRMHPPGQNCMVARHIEERLKNKHIHV